MHNSGPVYTAIIAATAQQLDMQGTKQHVLLRDYETRSTLKLRAVGTHRYAASPNTKVLCCAYAVDNQPVKLWRPGDDVPAEFIEAANNPNWTIIAHGDHFESAIERQTWRRARLSRSPS